MNGTPQSYIATRVVIIWTNITNYISASIKELATQGCELLVVQIVTNIAGNKVYRFDGMSNVTFIDLVDVSVKRKDIFLIDKIKKFDPNFVLISFNNRGIYYKIAKLCKLAAIPVVAASDGYFEGTIRQSIRIILSRIGFHKNYDAVFVPGFRAMKYAKQLNFNNKKIIQGLYTCDDKLFREVGINRHKNNVDIWPHVFLFTGQFIYRKGFDTLLKAYKIYRDQVLNPWELWIIGDGPLSKLAFNIEGVTNYGPLSAKDCSEKYGQAGCFILPSKIDHWPLVIHEATCSGLPIIASYSCGSTIELVQSFHNGLLINDSKVLELVDSMRYISNNQIVARDMGKNSLLMSWRYSASTWSNKVMIEIPKVLNS